MASALFRLFIVIALIMMPLGVGGGPALAAAAHQASTAGHCDEKSDKRKTPIRETMGCAGACTAIAVANLPVVAAANDQLALQPLANARQLAGINPEIATPPPKQS